ncbi:2,3-butanediol dehydrogenase [Bacillus sp. 165]|uniref:2,3-butanediol dehydrogenase n=1 Tax=Bacillus sp. 165 TaxID=1529117 RepID=UPI001ADB4119|nr:2,3-butanediol dehydrogenase [Bacillus sp. 165]MBO9129476.1 2,3-butanediol dehydrogenase [Bacillus sp. 165]
MKTEQLYTTEDIQVQATMKAAKFYKAKDFRIEEVPTPVVKPGHVIVDVEWIGICGSDMHEYTSGPLNCIPGTIMGHEFSAIVAEVGEGVTNVKVGDRVACVNLDTCGTCDYCKAKQPHLCSKIAVDGFGLYGFTNDGAYADKVLLKAENCIKVPDTMTMDHAALVEPASVALHAVKISKLVEGSTAVVFGAGPIGLFVSVMAKAKKASQVIVVEVAEDRLELARKLGATTVINPMKENAVEKIRELTNGGADVVFDAAGVQAVFSSATKVLAKKGELMVVAAYEKEVSFNPWELTMIEATISNSFCYVPEDFPEVIEIFKNSNIDLDLFITKNIHLDDLVEEGFETLVKDKNHIKILVTPKQSNL